MASVSFQIGEKFPSFLSLQSKLEQYQSANHVQLYKRSSRSLAAAKSRCPKKVFNDEIKFWELSYSCIHGGKQFKARGSGARNQSTFQMGCKAEIRLHASADGQNLEVKYLNEIHNHEVNETMFRNLFQQRRLDVEEKENISSLLGVKANKKMIQQKVMSETGKVVTLKDIHNIRASSKCTETDLTVLQRAIEHLNANPGAFVKVVSNDDNEMRGLYYQDQRMRQTFESYPEFICIDATYKVNDLRMPLYILLVENGNGQSEVVGIWLVADETEDMITQMVALFKEQNPAWSEVKTVMSDKDFVEREVFSKEFPDASLRICLFHVLRTFRREVTSEKMGVNKVQRDSVLQILQKIAYSTSLSDYETNKELLLGTNFQPAIAYFSQHWDAIKDQWVVGLSNSYSLGNKTNNRLESINQKIKQVVDKNAKFDSFAADMCVFLETHRTEIDGKVCQASSKVPVSYLGDETDVNRTLRQTLTPYAFNVIEKELNKFQNVDLIPREADTFQVNNTTVVATSESCSCTFKLQYMLPCRHIFAVRAKLEQPIFDDSLIPQRWTRKHYLKSLRITQTVNTISNERHQRTVQPQSQQQRYRAAFRVTQRLASCASEETRAVFDVRLQQLNALLKAWESGHDVVIQTTETESSEHEFDLPEPISDLSSTETGSDNDNPAVAMANTVTEDSSAIDSSLPSDDEIQPDVLPVEDNDLAEFRDIQLPPNIKKRGRPKGSELTVIGLPKKRLKLKRVLRPFDKLTDSEQSIRMLRWFVGDNVSVNCVNNGYVVTISDIISSPETLHLAATEQNVALVRCHFEPNAWVFVTEMIELAKKREWMCKVCDERLETRCIGCDLCLSWLHYHCAALSMAPKKKFWFCVDCATF